MSWNAPANLVVGSQVIFKGLAADDTGFGTWSATFTVGKAGAIPGNGITGTPPGALVQAVGEAVNLPTGVMNGMPGFDPNAVSNYPVVSREQKSWRR